VGDERVEPAGSPASVPLEERADPRPISLPDDSAGADRSGASRIVYRLLAAVTFGLAGFLGVTSAVSAAGTDLRAERQTDIADLARAQLQRARELDAELADLREEVDELLARQSGDEEAQVAQKELERIAPVAGLTAVTGPGVAVTLDDAPPSARSSDVDPDALVVHQQDIQAVANALWAGGAEAMTIQGQRIISTSAIRCVGNSVVLHGIPYPPPYRIEAVGDVDGMIRALEKSPQVEAYLSYAKDPRYGLGWKLERLPSVTIPAFDGSLTLDYARSADDASR
jgi:uncharacterized protein YlxW (UPF0749 family)